VDNSRSTRTKRHLLALLIQRVINQLHVVPIMSVMRTLLAASFCVLLSSAAFAALDVGKPAPALTINRVSGAPLQLNQYRGKVVVLALIDTTCPHCQALTGELNKIIKQYEGKGVQVVACAMNDRAKEALPQFEQQFQPAFPVGYCPADMVYGFTRFSVAAGKPFYVPHLVFLDRGGIVRGDYPGESDFMAKPESNIPAKIDELLKSGAPASAAAHKAAPAPAKQ